MMFSKFTHPRAVTDLFSEVMIGIGVDILSEVKIDVDVEMNPGVILRVDGDMFSDVMVNVGVNMLSNIEIIVTAPITLELVVPCTVDVMTTLEFTLSSA